MLRKSDFNLFTIEDLFIVYTDLFSYEFGMTKVKEIEAKVEKNKAVQNILSVCVTKRVAPQVNDYLAALNSATYFIFSKSETICLGSLIALRSCIYALNPLLANATNGSWHDVFVGIITQCHKNKMSSHSLFNQFYEKLEMLRVQMDPWNNLLEGSDEDGRYIIREFFQRDRISFAKYKSNMAAFDIQGAVIKALFNSQERNQSEYELIKRQILDSLTPSMHLFLHGNGPADMPRWTVAAYPDVIKWMGENIDNLDSEIHDLAAELESGVIIHNEFIRKTIDYYKRKVTRSLECSV